MLWCEWEKIGEMVQPIVEEMSGLITFISSHYDIELICDLQESIIGLGALLEEEYNMPGSDTISLLEDYCEILAVYAEKKDEFDTSILMTNWNKLIPTLKKDLQVRELSIVVIVKNEGKYIIEWLEYHILAGAHHFYIYDNDSTDDLYELLNEYISEGIVTYHNWPGKRQQLPAYNHAIETYKEETRYMAFIDADEFLMSVSGEKLVCVVDDIFKSHVGYHSKVSAAGIGVNWRTYGTSFHEKAVEGLIVRNYVYRGEDFSEMNKCIKTICNPRKVTGFSKNPHEVDYLEGSCCISENGSYIIGPWFYDGVCNKLRVNHYFSKSREECYNRFKKGKADSTYVWPEERIEYECNRAAGEYNKVYDYIMERYVDELEQRVQARQKGV